MKKIFLICLVFSAAVVATCTNKNQSTVDQQYLQSGEYGEFKKRSMLETRQNAQKRLSLRSFLKQFSNCTDVQRKTLPTEFGADQVKRLLEMSTNTCSIESDVQKIAILAESFTSEYTLRWILVEQKTAYRDQELVVSTYREGKLRSFATIGIFKDNLSERIVSNIRVRPGDEGVRISNTIIRKIIYPIEQENAIRNEYMIDEVGDISEL